MAKKILISIIAMFTMVSLFAVESQEVKTIPLGVKQTSQGGAHNQIPRGPIDIPEVYLEDNELSFDSSLEGCTVRLLDEEETVVFTAVISTGQTSVTFPSTLTGTYELQIVSGDLIFYGYIDL